MEATPGLVARKSRTSAGSTLVGTPAIDMPSDSRSRPQVPQTMTALTARLTAGSSHAHPVSRMTSPATTTPAETSASDAWCRKAPRRFMSLPRPEANSAAVTPLTTMPAAATIITVFPATSSGAPRRSIASSEIAPTVSMRKTALNRAARIDEPRRP